MSGELRPFHLALPVSDLADAAAFYCRILGCRKGRTASRWVDLDFFGHQVTLHLVDDDDHDDECSATNPVDGDSVPSRHFGVVLDMLEWGALAERLQTLKCEFLISPRIRFASEVGEQATLFLRDPSGNALEFKSFADQKQMFAV